MLRDVLKKIKEEKVRLIKELSFYNHSKSLNTRAKRVNDFNGRSYVSITEITEVFGVSVQIRDTDLFIDEFSEAYREVKRTFYKGSVHILATRNIGLYSLAQEVVSRWLDPLEFEDFIVSVLEVDYKNLPDDIKNP